MTSTLRVRDGRARAGWVRRVLVAVALGGAGCSGPPDAPVDDGGDSAEAPVDAGGDAARVSIDVLYGSDGGRVFARQPDVVCDCHADWPAPDTCGPGVSSFCDCGDPAPCFRGGAVASAETGAPVTLRPLVRHGSGGFWSFPAELRGPATLSLSTCRGDVTVALPALDVPLQRFTTARQDDDGLHLGLESQGEAAADGFAYDCGERVDDAAGIGGERCCLRPTAPTLDLPPLPLDGCPFPVARHVLRGIAALPRDANDDVAGVDVRLWRAGYTLFVPTLVAPRVDAAGTATVDLWLPNNECVTRVGVSLDGVLVPVTLRIDTTEPDPATAFALVGDGLQIAVRDGRGTIRLEEAGRAFVAVVALDEASRIPWGRVEAPPLRAALPDVPFVAEDGSATIQRSVGMDLFVPGLVPTGR